MRLFIYLICLALVVYILYLSYHFMIKIAIAVAFPVDDAQMLFWASVGCTILHTLVKGTKD